MSEVGFGTWTLASDWWGHIEDKQGMLHAALDTGINFIDTAPVYGDDGVGETLLADVLKTNRDEIVLTTKCGYDHDAPRMFPGQSERPQDWHPSSIRLQLEGSLRRLGTDYVDLYQLHNARIEPVLDDSLWEVLGQLKAEGKIREIGIALGPAIGWVEEGLEAIRRRDIASLQTVFNIIEQEPGLTFAKEIEALRRRHRDDRPRAARLGHALGEGHSRHRVPARRSPVAPQPGQHARQLRQGRHASRSCGKAPAARAGRRRSPASLPIRRSPRSCPPMCDIDDVREYAAASEMPLTADEVAQLDEMWRENFGIENRYEMPLKSSR